MSSLTTTKLPKGMILVVYIDHQTNAHFAGIVLPESAVNLDKESAIILGDRCTLKRTQPDTHHVTLYRETLLTIDAFITTHRQEEKLERIEKKLAMVEKAFHKVGKAFKITWNEMHQLEH